MATIAIRACMERILGSLARVTSSLAPNQRMPATLDEYASLAQSTGGPARMSCRWDHGHICVAIVREPAPGQKITIDDRAGAIGANVVAKAAPDGLCNIRFRNGRFSTLESA
jgi:hypothetical protein